MSQTNLVDNIIINQFSKFSHHLTDVFNFFVFFEILLTDYVQSQPLELLYAQWYAMSCHWLL